MSWERLRECKTGLGRKLTGTDWHSRKSELVGLRNRRCSLATTYCKRLVYCDWKFVLRRPRRRVSIDDQGGLDPWWRRRNLLGKPLVWTNRISLCRLREHHQHFAACTRLRLFSQCECQDQHGDCWPGVQVVS